MGQSASSPSAPSSSPSNERHFHEPHVPKPADLNDPRNAPFNWLGGKWFVVKDYALSHDVSTAVKSFSAGSFAGCLS